MTTISCGAAYGVGGLGKHLAQLVEESRARDALCRYYTTSGRSDDAAAVVVPARQAARIGRIPPIRFSAGWRSYLSAELFDRAVAARLERDDTLIAFAGQALHSFQRAKDLGYERLELVSPTCHVDAVAHQHRLARSAYPIEGAWLNERLRRKTVREYELADRIHVASSYVRESFVTAGVSPERLKDVQLRVEDRFVPASDRQPRPGLHVVYVGGLSVAKGVPVLLDAFAELDDPAAQLTLVGGWGSRGMRRFLEQRVADDSRIAVTNGDPLPYLHAADVLVHPSYQDGFGLAPFEAVACDIPVVVSADTGMSEMVEHGVDGWVVPTGDVAALADRLRALASTRRASALRTG